MLEKALEYAHQHRTDYLEELFDFLRIPSVSTLSERRSDIKQAAEWLADKMRAAGLDEVRVMPTGGYPVVYGEWLGVGDDAPTVLVYGHYDVQPTDPVDLWDTEPFEPEVRDGRIYARGASDDKGQAYIHVKAVEAMLAAEGTLPVNVKMFFEGEEEIGSPNLDAFVEENIDLLAADSGLISDGRIISPEQPSIVYALRGLSYMEFRLRGPKRDLHSGTYGGSIHNPAQLVGEIIAALHDENGTITIPGFYDNVRPLTDADRKALGEVPYTLEQWQRETGLESPWGESEYSLIERVTARPTCEVNGIWGGFQGEGSKTVIPAEAGAKVSMRLVPDQDPERISRLFTEYVLELTGDRVEVEVLNHAGAWPSIAPIDLPEMGAASRAYEATWGKSPVFTREGGSIPVVATIQQKLDAPVILMGFGLDDNIHSPNENFSVDHYYKGIDTIINYYHYLSEL